MPQTADNKSYHNIQRTPETGTPVSAQRNVNVVAEPCGKADVPSRPEFADVTRKIGIVEILHEVETQQGCQPDGNVGIAGKIAKYLDGKKNRTQRQCRGGGCFIMQKNRIDDRSHRIGYGNFGKKTPQHLPEPVGGPVVIERF